MNDLAYPSISLLPPVVAIVLAIATRRVVASLLIGVGIGVGIVSFHNKDSLWEFLIRFFRETLWSQLIDTDHLQVFVFTLLMGAMVRVMHGSGGMHGLVELVSRWAKTRRKGQVATWFLGLLIFFDDYANTLLLGGTMRPLTDRLKISREKLAYLVDSTAAPVAGLALLSTWIAGEIDYIQNGLKQTPLAASVNGFEMFVATIPYRFYVVFALAMVLFIAMLGRDFGPMLRSERRAVAGGNDPRPGPDEDDKPAVSTSSDSLELRPGTPHRSANAIVPIVLIVVVMLLVMWQTGYQTVTQAGGEYYDPDASWLIVLGRGNSYRALVVASFVGLIVMVLLVAAQRLMTSVEVVRAIAGGCKSMLPALLILWMAWSLSFVTSDQNLGTSHYLGDMLENLHMPVELLPTVVFVVASITAFCTGTSWGTMSILTPITVKVSYIILAPDGAEELDPEMIKNIAGSPILLASIGSVLAGAIFGDHCSPISDTTVLSSTASGCNHVAHVRTQMPYALTVAGVSILLGTLPIGYGVPLWLLLVAGLVLLVLIVRYVGRLPDENPISTLDG